MSDTIQDLPMQERPRERLASKGADALKDSELLAIVLRTGTKGTSALRLAEQILQQFQTLDNLARASIADLCKVHGIGRDKAIGLKAAFTLAKRMAEQIHGARPVLDNPDVIAEIMREESRGRAVETFWVLMLNTRRHLVSKEMVSQGTLDTLLVHPREVFKSAITNGAAAIVLVHNHPSGDPTPSEADIKVTRDLIRAGQLLKIEVLDHVVMGRKTQDRPQDYMSLRELGYFYS